MINKLASILFWVILNAVACSPDITKAFLVIGLSKRDGDSCRFFWLFDPFVDGETADY